MKDSQGNDFQVGDYLNSSVTPSIVVKCTAIKNGVATIRNSHDREFKLTQERLETSLWVKHND